MPDDETTDRFLVERYRKSRDEESFRALYRRHATAVYRLCLGVTTSEADAADAVQEAWLRALRGLDRFRWGSTFRTWLSGIALNCCRELLRRRGDDAPESVPELRVARPHETTRDALRALSSLPERAREVFVLHELFGYTHGEIGELLAVEAGTSKSQLSYARQRIRRWSDERSPKRGVPDAG